MMRRFYEISPAWPSGEGPRIEVDGWNVSLTASVSLAFVEAWYGRSLPTSAWLASKPRAVPELVRTGAETPIVSARLKSVIEAQAAGAAEFRPFSLRFANGAPAPGEWHLCNLLQRIDCFDYEALGIAPPDPAEVKRNLKHVRTNPISDEEYWLRESSWNVLIGARHVDPAALDGARIWRPRWRPADIFVAGELLKACKDAGVKGVLARRLATREDPLPEFGRKEEIAEESPRMHR